MAAIDVGTRKICALFGGYDDRGRLRITGIGVTPSQGITKGVVDDVSKATKAIRDAVQEAAHQAETQIESAIVGIGGAHIACLNSRGTVALPSLDRPISAEEVQRALEGARTVAIPNNREILHAIPRYFVVDGDESSGDPIGRFGHRLDVEAHIITGAVTMIQNLTRCVEAAGVHVDALALPAIGAAEAVLTAEEREHGVVLADIGAGTTSVAVFAEGAIQHTAVLPVGGNTITKDVGYGLRAPSRSADTAKEMFGHALADAVPSSETVEVETFGSDGKRVVSRRMLCEIIQARVEEMLEMVRHEAVRVGPEEMIAAGIVLTGGAAALPGIVELAERVLRMPARVAIPAGVYHLDEGLLNPAFSASVGLLGIAVREHEAVLRPARATRSEARAGGGMRARLAGIWKVFSTS